MNSRDRVLKAINHQEPDRVPLDLGGTIVSGIMAHALDRLRKYLRLKIKPVRVFELFQMLGEVEQDVIERLKIDVLPVEPLKQFFGIKRENYKPWKLWDGTEVLMPGEFDVEIDSNGNWLLHSEGNKDKPVEGKMPKNGFYFDMPSVSGIHDNFVPPSFNEIKKQFNMETFELEYLANKAEHLRKTTDKALVLDCWFEIGLPWVGSIPDFLMLLYTNKKYVRELFNIRTETAIKNLEKLKTYLKDNIDIIVIDGYDFAGQDKEFFSPEIFEELFLPFYKIQNKWIHANTGWKTIQHICGSIHRFLPLLIESNLDIINPVQISAKGMEPFYLKNNFGDKIVFWGGGIDIQRTLQFGTTEQIRQEVIENLKVFAPGGGYVFHPTHNIQQGTPPENIITAYETAIKFGVYPKSF